MSFFSPLVHEWHNLYDKIPWHSDLSNFSTKAAPVIGAIAGSVLGGPAGAAAGASLLGGVSAYQTDGHNVGLSLERGLGEGALAYGASDLFSAATAPTAAAAAPNTAAVASTVAAAPTAAPAVGSSFLSEAGNAADTAGKYIGDAAGAVKSAYSAVAPYVSDALKVAPVAMDYQSMQANKGNQALVNQQLQAQNTNAAAETALGQQFIGAYKAGTLPAGQQDQIHQFVASQTEKIKQLYASYGMSGSTSETEALASVSQQAAVVQQNMLDGLLQQGSALMSGANVPMTSLIQYETSQSAALNASLANLAKSIGQLP